MPIVLHVAHLPSAATFFLSALQPLGYRYQYTQGNRIGLGVHHADFFLQQSSDTPRSRHSPEHIRFHSPSRAAVRECYTAAIYAGAKPLQPPADRINRVGEGEVDVFNTFIMDRDGNNIEVTYGHDDYDRAFAGSETNGTAIRGWQRNVAEEYVPSRAASEAPSYSSSRRGASKADQSLVSARHSIAESARPTQVSRRTSARSATMPVAAPPPPPEGFPMPALVRQFSGPIETMLGKTDGISGSVPMKTVAGTMLGAAAGAAFAYAMCKSEDGAETCERWRYVKWDNNNNNPTPQYADHEGIAPSSHAATPALQSQMSRLAIEAAPPRSRASGPPMAFDRYEARSRAATQVGDDSRSRRRSSSQVSAHSEPASRRSSSRASRSQSVREPPPSRHGSSHDRSSARRSGRSSSAQAPRREESRHSHRTRTSYTMVEDPRSSRAAAGRSSAHHSVVTAIRDPPAAAGPPSSRQLAMVHAGAPVVDEPSDMELDNIDCETVVPSDSISCVGEDRHSRRSAGRSLRSSTHHSKPSSHHRSGGGSKYSSGMKSFHDRIVDIEKAGGSVETPISARRVSRMVY